MRELNSLGQQGVILPSLGLERFSELKSIRMPLNELSGIMGAN
jgi:hypothetical protein